MSCQRVCLPCAARVLLISARTGLSALLKAPDQQCAHFSLVSLLTGPVKLAQAMSPLDELCVTSVLSYPLHQSSH